MASVEIGRILEIVIYALLNFFPYLMLVVYPFWDQCRYSKKVTAVLIAIVTIVQIVLGMCAALFTREHSAAMLSLISTVLYVLFYFWAFRGNFGKMLFTLLMFSNIANFVVISSKCIEGMFFPDYAIQNYRWTFTLVMFFVELLVLIPLFFYVKKIYTPAFKANADGFVWGYLWLVPATFYLCWYYTTYYNNLPSLNLALRPDTTIFLLFINLGAFLIVHIVIRMIKEQNKNRLLEENNHQLEMQSLQYKNLQERMMETRRARHDIRHHMVAMRGYLEQDDYDGLKQYLNDYICGLPEDETLVFCEHSIINMIVVYFSQMAKEKEIDFSAAIDVPEKVGISDSDLSVLFGNLLENAIHACSIQKSTDRRIELKSSYKNGNIFVLTVDNTFENEVKKDKQGIFLSTKHKGNGIGVESVKNIAQRYQGVCQIETENGMFRVSVMLKG